jgi:hypothetical protein
VNAPAAVPPAAAQMAAAAAALTAVAAAAAGLVLSVPAMLMLRPRGESGRGPLPGPAVWPPAAAAHAPPPLLLFLPLMDTSCEK